MKRIVSIHLPHWPIERVSNKDKDAGPARPEAPFALVAESHRGLLLHALNEPARLMGLSEGERLVDARARVPELASQPADPPADKAALEKLALWCGRYGAASSIEMPLAEAEGDPRGIWIDITGVSHLFGGEAPLLGDLSRRLAMLGLSAGLGLASTHAAAFAVARYCQGPRIEDRIVAPRHERQALAALPVAGLDLEPATFLLLRRLGLKCIADLYPIPRASLERRFSSSLAARAVLHRLDLALGLAPETLRPIRPPVRFLVRRAFAEPLISAEGVTAATSGLCEELCAELEAKGRGVRRLRLSAYRTDASMLEAAVGTSTPCRDAGHMQRLLEEKLERVDAGFGLDAISLAVLRSEPMPAAQKAFASTRVAYKPYDRLLDRLANRLGAENVCRIAARESHMPERAHAFVSVLEEERPRVEGREGRAAEGGSGRRTAAAMKAIQPRSPLSSARSEIANGPGVPTSRPACGPSRPPLLLPEPEAIEVVAEIPDGPPARFTWRRLPRRVVLAEGPERIAPEWWREIAKAPTARSRTRDYFRIEDDSGRRYWVFREGLYRRSREDEGGEGEAGDERAPRWFMHGLYG